MKVLGLVGSMRKNMYTDKLVRNVIENIGKQLEVDSEILYTADMKFKPCQVRCHDYCTYKPYSCSVKDDTQTVFEGMKKADILILGAPHYFRGPPAGFHTLIERIQSMAFYQETEGFGEPSPLKGKPVGLVAVAEYSNPHVILEYLHDFVTLLKMRPVQLDHFPYLGVGGHGNIEKDEIFKPYELSKELAEKLVETYRSI